MEPPLPQEALPHHLLGFGSGIAHTRVSRVLVFPMGRPFRQNLKRPGQRGIQKARGYCRLLANGRLSMTFYLNVECVQGKEQGRCALPRVKLEIKNESNLQKTRDAESYA